jgi:hypothetical protein
MGALALRAADLREFEGEARVEDLRIAELLGYATPTEVRRVIRRHLDEIHTHGVLPQSDRKNIAARFSGQSDRKIARGRGRPERIFMLNEAQAVLVTMFSRTERAAQVRQQIVQVFLAWRHGKLVPAHEVAPETRALEGLVQRIELLERAMGSRTMVGDPEFAKALTYTPAIFRHRHGSGRVRNKRFPSFWGDMEVRQALISMHRQMTIDRVHAELRNKFGENRTPSRSAIGRFFKDYDNNWGF